MIQNIRFDRVTEFICISSTNGSQGCFFIIFICVHWGFFCMFYYFHWFFFFLNQLDKNHPPSPYPDKCKKKGVVLIRLCLMILTIFKIFGQFIPQGSIGDVFIVNNEHNDFSLLILYRCKQHTTEETATCEKKIIIILN